MPDTINHSLLPFIAYGDECKAGDNDTLVYAYVIVPRHRLHVVELRLRRLKRKYRIPRELIIHCSPMRNEHERRKLGIPHVRIQDINSLTADIVTLINENSIGVRYAVGSLSEMQQALPAQLAWHDENGPTDKFFSTECDYKGHLGMMSLACLTPMNGLPDQSNCEIICAAEPSMARFFGQNRQADSILGGFNDRAERITPTIVAAHEAACLQIADVAAYICANANRTDREIKFYRDQFARIKYWTRSVSHLGDEPRSA